MSAPAVLYEKRVGYWFVTRRRTVISSDSRFGIPTEPKRRRVGTASVSLPAIYGTDQAVSEQPFTVITPGGTVRCQVTARGRSVTVDMGQMRFDSREIPVLGLPREVLRETLVINGQPLEYCAATIGNPHCVVLRHSVSEAEAKDLGPLIETESRFPNRTNVQFLQVLDRQNIKLEIWERGAGYTLASGSSSCAAAAVAKKLGQCDSSITVHMPGGELAIEIDTDFLVRMVGPVAKVAEGWLSEEALEGAS